MLYKRPGSKEFQIKFALDGQTIRRSSRTSDRKLAERVEHSLRQSIIEARLNGSKAPFSWEQAKDLWRAEKATKRSLWLDESMFRSMDEFFTGIDVSELTDDACAKYKTVIAKRTSFTTANRHVALLRGLIKILEQRKIVDNGHVLKEYKVETIEPPFVKQDQLQVLLDALPDYARNVVEFARHTGIRRSNVLAMQWDWVDLDGKRVVIPARFGKGRKTMALPLSDDAVAVLRRTLGQHPSVVFPTPNKTAFREIFKKVRKDVGMEWFKFHYTRHTFASYHTVNGTPPIQLMKLGGWSNLKMVQRYAHLRDEDVAMYAGNSKS